MLISGTDFCPDMLMVVQQFGPAEVSRCARHAVLATAISEPIVRENKLLSIRMAFCAKICPLEHWAK